MIRVDCEKYNDVFSALAESAFINLGLKGDAVVETDFVTAEEIHALNRETRGVDRETDVLSYPALDGIKPFTKENYPYDYNAETGEVELGSIVICGEVASRQAEEYGHGELRENCFLFVHGLLHLLGYDHIEEKDRVLMREKEELILSTQNIVRGD